MPESSQNLGKLISIHGTSPASLQRAAVVAIVSFLFFLAMLIAFYIRQQIGYFILSSAFLVVNLFTMIGIWMQQRNTLKIYENGIRYKKFKALWTEISGVDEGSDGSVRITTSGGKNILLNPAIHGLSDIARILIAKTGTP